MCIFGEDYLSQSIGAGQRGAGEDAGPVGIVGGSFAVGAVRGDAGRAIYDIKIQRLLA